MLDSFRLDQLSSEEFVVEEGDDWPLVFLRNGRIERMPAPTEHAAPVRA